MIVNERQKFDWEGEGPLTVLITVFIEKNQSLTLEVQAAKKAYWWY